MNANAQTLVTPEAPWLGLRAFTEELRPYFFGRDRELNDLFERMAQKPLTVLFGQSGLGKTSLIQAALMPRLQSAGFARVRLRLDHGEQAPPLEQQVLAALRGVVDDSVQMPADDLPAPLWRLLHDPGFGLCREGAPRVVLMLDQFEEIFTLGESSPKRRDASRAFMNALADVVENRVPTALRPIIEADDDFADRLDYGARPLKLLISLREDFLHRLERWRAQMPSLMDNRLELRLLTGPQALQAVVEPGKLRCKTNPGLPPIVSEQTGEAIVRFVADVEADVPLAEIDAVPPLLSLLCAELNAQRGDSPTIRSEQIEGRAEDILSQFYERCFAPHPAAVRRFVEDRLLSPEGFRQNANEDTFLHDMERAGLTEAQARAVLAQLVDDRLIVSEERGGIHRIELTHDTLTGVARTSRDQRLEREEKERAEHELLLAQQRNRRRRMVMAAMVLLTSAAGAGLWWALLQKSALSVALSGEQKAQKAQVQALADTEHGTATHWLRDKDEKKALTSLAQALSWQPAHQKASVLTAFLLEQQSPAEQLLPAEVHRLSQAEAGTLELDEARRWALSHDGARIIVRDPATWQEKGRSEPLGKIAWAHWNKDKIGVFSADGKFHVFTPGEHGDLATVEHHAIGQGVRRVVWTPDGKPALAVLRDANDATNAVGDDRAVGELIRFFADGDAHAPMVRSAGKVGSAHVTPDGRRALVLVRGASDGQDELRVYAADSDKPLWHLECVRADEIKVMMRADGLALMLVDKFVRRLDLRTLREWSFQPSVFRDETTFSADGVWAVVYDNAYKLLLFPPDEQAAPQAGRGLKPGPLGSLVVTELPVSHSCVFTNNGQNLIVSRADKVPGRAMSIYFLDVKAALLGFLDEPEIEFKFYDNSKLSPLGDNGFVIWEKEKSGHAYLITGEDSDKWSSLRFPFSQSDFDGELALMRVGEGLGLTARKGSKVLAWENVRDSNSVLRESEEVTSAGAVKDRWLTATANHVALWPLALEKPEDEQVLGFDPGNAREMRFESGRQAVRQLRDGRWLWKSRYEEEGHWGLADAGRELVTFVTPEITDDLPTQATCTEDGSRIFVANAKGDLQAWDTQAAAPRQVVLPPAPDARLITLHQSEPRALYLQADGRCVDVDLTGQRQPVLLGALPRSAFVRRGAIALPGDQGWLVGCLNADRKHMVFQLDARHTEAVPLSAPHPDTEYPGGLVMKFALSPSGRYWAALAMERSNNSNQWFWCLDTKTGKTLFDDTSPVYLDLKNPRLEFDEAERFVGADAGNPFTFDLGGADGKPEFPVLVSKLSLAAQATAGPTPEWLPEFLNLLADGMKGELRSREEVAAQLGVGSGAEGVFARLAGRWVGPVAAKYENPARDPFDAVREQKGKFDDLDGKADKREEAGAALRKLIALYRERAASAPLSTHRAAKFGEALLRGGEFAQAVDVLTAAAKAFPFHVTYKTTVEEGRELRSHLAYALWLSGRKEEAVRYAQEHRFHDWLWNASREALTIYKPDRAEDIDCDAELRAATRKLPKPEEEGKGTAPEPANNGARTAAKFARDRAWAAIGSASLSSDPALRRSYLEEGGARLAEAVSAAQLDAPNLSVKKGGYIWEPQKVQADSLHNLVNDMVHLARVQLALGREDEAKATLAKADGFFSQVLPIVQARLRQTQGRKDEAMRLWSSIANAYPAAWSATAEAAFGARQWGELMRAREFLQIPTTYPHHQRFAGTLIGWLEWEQGNDREALASWTDAEHGSSTSGAGSSSDGGPVPHDFMRGDWLPGMAAVLAGQRPEAALAYWRVCLHERPELALPGALDADFMGNLWSWQNRKIETVRPLQRLDELRKRLRALHARLPEDERIAAEAGGLLAVNRKDAAVRLLAKDGARFPASPWIALQQAAIATQDRDDARALDCWQLAFTGLEGEAELIKEATEGVPLSGDGRPQFKDFLQLAQRTKGGVTGGKLAALLPAARRLLQSETETVLDGWLLLAALDDDPEERSISVFAAELRAFNEKHPRYIITQADEDLQKQLHAGLTLANALHERLRRPPLETYARLYQLLGSPGKDHADWRAQLTKWQAPANVLNRLKLLHEAARKQPAEEAALAAPDPARQIDWLRSLGHEDAAAERELRSEADPDKRAALLLKRGAAQDFDEVIKLLRPIMDEEKSWRDSGVGRRIAIARALDGKGRREEALKLLVEMFESPPLRQKLHRDASPDEALGLIVKIASALGRPREALKIIETAALQVPENEAIAKRAGWCALAQERYDAALELFERCQDEGNKETRLIGTAIALWHQGRKDAALAAYFDNLREKVSRGTASYRPAELPEGFAPDLAALRAAMTEAVFEQQFRAKNADSPAQFVWKADALWNLGLKDAAVSAARAALGKADVKDAGARASAAWALADFMGKRPNHTDADLKEAEQIAAEAVRLNPDSHAILAQWLHLLCLTKNAALIPEAFHRALSFEKLTASEAQDCFTELGDCGGLALMDQLYQVEPASRQAELRSTWIAAHIQFGEFQRALDLAAEHRDTLSEDFAAKVRAFGKAGINRGDEALVDYIDQLSHDSSEAAMKIEDSQGEWKRLRTQLRAQLARLPAEVLLGHARRLLAIDRARLLTFARSLDELKRWPEAFGVHELLLSTATDNLSGTAISFLLADRCLHAATPDASGAMRYLSEPMWTLPSGTAAFAVNDEVAGKLNTLCFNSLATRSPAVTRRCIELRVAAASDQMSAESFIHGYELEQIGDASGADAACAAALKRYGPTPAVLNERAWVLFNRDQYDEAVALIAQADPHYQASGNMPDNNFQLLRGALFWSSNKHDAAIEAFRKGATQNPEFLVADYFAAGRLDAGFWSAKERAVLESLRKATLEKHPDLVKPKAP